MIAGIFDMWEGAHDDAAEHLDAAIAAARELGDDELLAYATLARSMTAGPGEGEDVAEQLAIECVAQCRALGDRWAEAAALNVLGWLYVAQERFDEQSPVFEETFAVAEEVGDEHFMALAEVNLAEARLHAGDIDGRVRAPRVRRGAAAVRGTALSVAVPPGCGGAGRGRAGRPDRAARLLGAADRQRETMSISVWGSQATRRVRFVEDVAQGSAVTTRSTTLLAQGAALTFDDAVDLVTGS